MCKCEKMDTKRKNVNSFKVEVPVKDKESIMQPEVWGKNITINHFLHLRRRPTIGHEKADLIK